MPINIVIIVLIDYQTIIDVYFQMTGKSKFVSKYSVMLMCVLVSLSYEESQKQTNR